MKVLVCGGREYTNAEYVNRILDQIHSVEKITEVIQGGARGADTLALQWAESRSIPSIITFRAQWQKFGNAAGPIRNADMLKYGQPDLVVAFPGGSGTQNMISLANRAKLPLIVLEDRNG